MKITAYTVVQVKDRYYSSHGIPELETRVEELIGRGWQPLGGVAFTYSDGGYFFQAMVQYERSFAEEHYA